MTGPEHYREAERLIEAAEGSADEGMANFRARVAQVHATLALAAATLAERAVGPQEQWGGNTVWLSDDAWREAIA